MEITLTVDGNLTSLTTASKYLLYQHSDFFSDLLMLYILLRSYKEKNSTMVVLQINKKNRPIGCWGKRFDWLYSKMSVKPTPLGPRRSVCHKVFALCFLKEKCPIKSLG